MPRFTNNFVPGQRMPRPSRNQQRRLAALEDLRGELTMEEPIEISSSSKGVDDYGQYEIPDPDDIENPNYGDGTYQGSDSDFIQEFEEYFKDKEAQKAHDLEMLEKQSSEAVTAPSQASIPKPMQTYQPPEIFSPERHRELVEKGGFRAFTQPSLSQPIEQPNPVPTPDEIARNQAWIESQRERIRARQPIPVSPEERSASLKDLLRRYR